MDRNMMTDGPDGEIRAEVPYLGNGGRGSMTTTAPTAGPGSRWLPLPASAGPCVWPSGRGGW